MTLGRDQSRIGADARAGRPHNLLPNCLDQPMEESFYPLTWSLRETKNDGSTGSARERHGLFPVAPSERPVFAAHRSSIREWYCPQARIAGRLTFQPLVRFRAHYGFLLA
jgi:hypothetical protein